MIRARRVVVFALLLSGARVAGAQAQEEGVGEGVGTGQRVIKPPKLVTFVEAEYPPEEKSQKKQASVVLTIAITESGKVAAVAVSQSAGPAFDAAAMAAAKQFVFEPAEVNGKPTPVKIQYKYDFVIKEAIVKRTTGDFVGIVRERGTKRPLPNVTVGLDSGQNAVTNGEGHFEIKDAPPGKHAVTISGEGITPIGTEETIELAKQLDATYDIELKKTGPSEDDEDFEVMVVTERLGKSIVSTEISATVARQVPGTSGDVLKVVENLPGVARAAVGSGQIVVWGAAPEDTRVYVDGVRIPRLYHDGGFRSVVHSDMVKSVELVPGGYGASYGRGLGGLITVMLKPMDEEKIHGALNADTIDGSASLYGPVGKNIHFAGAVRKSWIDGIIKAFGEKDVQDIVPLPSYFDTQARVKWNATPTESIELGGLMSSDSTTRSLLEPDPKDTKRDARDVAFGRIWTRYEKKLKNGDIITVLPSWGRDYNHRKLDFGGTPSEIQSESDVFGLRAQWRGQPMKWLTVQVGIDADFTRQTTRRTGSVTTPPREGDLTIFGLPPANGVNSDKWNTVVGSIAPFVEGDIALFKDTLHVVPGLRVEPYFTSGDRSLPVQTDDPAVGFFTNDIAAEPRVSVRWQATPRVTAKGAFGFYHQPPMAEDLSAVFGNPKLGLAFARHALLGAAYKLTPSLTAEITGFYNTMESLTSRSAAATPLLAQALVQEGIGRSFGMQIMLRQEQWGPFFGWISYSLIRSERKDHPDTPWRVFDYDQSHVLTAVGAVAFKNGWEFGARFRFATGYPRTPVVGIANYIYADGTQYPVLGAQNSIRIPVFWQADVRVAKHFKIAKTDLEIYLDVQNVTNHENPEELVYSANYKTQGYITGLPIYPVLGVKWTF